MAYSVKEIFYSLQGEGANTGRAAVFCRFTGCNLWSGRERDRENAICRFCDTQFVGTNGLGGGRFRDATELTERLSSTWYSTVGLSPGRFVVFTGGEPLLQLDAGAVKAAHREGFEVAVETNGTCEAPAGLDWICVSPKAGTELLVRSGDELKLVFPQEGAEPERYEGLRFQYFFIQPMDGPDISRNVRNAMKYCLDHPRWRLSLQTHKIIGLP